MALLSRVSLLLQSIGILALEHVLLPAGCTRTFKGQASFNPVSCAFAAQVRSARLQNNCYDDSRVGFLRVVCEGHILHAQ
jgi:hypothetical protein